jgi:hypothetical protein
METKHTPPLEFVKFTRSDGEHRSVFVTPRQVHYICELDKESCSIVCGGGDGFVQVYGSVEQVATQLGACNSHEELLAASNYIDSAAPETDGLDESELVNITVTVKGLRDFRAAIAKAEGR